MRLSPVLDHVSRGPASAAACCRLHQPGCTMLTMGGTCVAHDPPVTIVFPRGRPFAPERLRAPRRVDASRGSSRR